MDGNGDFSHNCCLREKGFGLPSGTQKQNTSKIWPLEKQVPTWYAKQTEIMVASVDDEPNLYLGNGWKSQNIHLKLVVWGTK